MHYSDLSNYRHKLILTLQWTYSSDFDWHPCVLLQTVYIRVCHRRLLFIKNTLTHIYILSSYCTPPPEALPPYTQLYSHRTALVEQKHDASLLNAMSRESYIFSQLFFTYLAPNGVIVHLYTCIQCACVRVHYKLIDNVTAIHIRGTSRGCMQEWKKKEGKKKQFYML